MDKHQWEESKEEWKESQAVREMETELGKNESDKCKYKQHKLGEHQQKHRGTVYHSCAN